MKFNSEIYNYPNYQSNLKSIISNIVYFLNMEEELVGSIIIGETVREINSLHLEIEKNKIETLLTSGVIFPIPTSINFKVLTKFIEIEVEPGNNKPYMISKIKHLHI